MVNHMTAPPPGPPGDEDPLGQAVVSAARQRGLGLADEGDFAATPGGASTVRMKT